MGTTNLARNITLFVEKTKVKAEQVVRKLALDMLRGVIIKSPVDTGRFRASWRVGINTVDLTTEEEGQIGSGDAMPGSGRVQSARRTLKLHRRLSTEASTEQLGEFKLGDIIYISNNLPYAEPLENGWSDQAPQGMMKNTFQEVVHSFDETVRGIASGGSE